MPDTEIDDHVEAADTLRSCLGGRDADEPLGRLAEAAVEFIEAQDCLLARRAAELERLRSERREQLDEAVRQRVTELLAANSELTTKLETAEAALEDANARQAAGSLASLQPYRAFIFSEDIDILLSEACAENDQCQCPTCQLARLRDTLRNLIQPPTPEET